MKKHISPKIVSIVFSIFVLCFAITFYVIGQWIEPSIDPPGGNVNAPINASNIGQTKMGGLALNTGVDGIISSDGAANGLLIYEGNVGIGTTDPSMGSDGTQLKLDVDGPIGATEYCDQDGNNCKIITEIGGGGTTIGWGEQGTDNNRASCDGRWGAMSSVTGTCVWQYGGPNCNYYCSCSTGTLRDINLNEISDPITENVIGNYYICTSP